MISSRLFLRKEALTDALRRPSSWVLIGVNLGLIVAVIAWDWQVFDIVFLYWVENLIIGAINVLKMICASPGDQSLTSLISRLNPASRLQQSERLQSELTRSKLAKYNMASVNSAMKLFLIPFFIIHYGAFCYGHGMFIFSIFSDGELTGHGKDVISLLTPAMLIAMSLLAASHLFSFFRNFIAAGEYRNTHPMVLMMRPYGRIVALHITIIFGAFLTMAFGSPLGLLVVLMVLKTLVDLAMHQSERNKFQRIY